MSSSAKRSTSGACGILQRVDTVRDCTTEKLCAVDYDGVSERVTAPHAVRPEPTEVAMTRERHVDVAQRSGGRRYSRRGCHGSTLLSSLNRRKTARLGPARFGCHGVTELGYGRYMTDNGVGGRDLLIKAAAQEMVARDGALEVADVVERSGRSSGALYHHFPSKAALVAAVVGEFYDRQDAEVVFVDPAPDAHWAEREHRRTELFVRFNYSDPLAPVILTSLAREPAVAVIEAERRERVVDQAAANIRSGQVSGEIDRAVDPGLAAALIIGGMRHAMARALLRRRRPAATRVAEEMWRFVAGGLALGERRPAKRASSVHRLPRRP